MELLFRRDIGPTTADINEVIQTDLRIIIHSHIKMEREDPHAVSSFMIFYIIIRRY